MEVGSRRLEFKGTKWSDEEVMELLHLWADEWVQTELESCLRNQHVFVRIANLLRERGIYRSGEQCRDKIKKLKVEYQRIRQQRRGLRGGRAWKFYQEMDRVLNRTTSASLVSGPPECSMEVVTLSEEHSEPVAPNLRDLSEVKCESAGDPEEPPTVEESELADRGFSPSGSSDHQASGSTESHNSLEDGAVLQSEEPRCPRRRQRSRKSPLGKVLVQFLDWQREVEEQRLEREAEREERRLDREEDRLERERKHQLTLISILTSVITTMRTRHPESSQSNQYQQTSGHLSQRGQTIRQHVGILQEGFNLYHTDKHDICSNPDGIINMGTSENKLSYDLLSQRLTQADMLHLEPSLLQYPDWKGHRVLREEVARFLSEHCKCPSPLKAENVVVMNGCGSLFSSLAAVLCDPDDAILIPTPFYGVITEDVRLYSGVKLCHVPLECEPGSPDHRPFQLTVDKLETALVKARRECVRVRALILVNPHNPLGEVYSEQEMMSFLLFAHRHHLHVVVDEVYMLSVFQEPAAFHSVLGFSRLPDAQRTHVLWGVSKDFGAAGLRVGTLYSENQALVQALDQLAGFHGVSGPTQHQVSRLLQDRDWVQQEFLPQNHARMRDAHEYVCEELQRLGVPFLRRTAGFFIWADFRKYLREQSFEEEQLLWQCFLMKKVLLSCGQAFSCTTPGWFRIVFTDKRACLQLGMQRITQALMELQQESISAITHKITADVRLSKLETKTERQDEESEHSPCGTSHSGDTLDSLIGQLQQHIRCSDWLEKNTPELPAGDDPKEFEVFMDLLMKSRTAL